MEMPSARNCPMGALLLAPRHRRSPLDLLTVSGVRSRAAPARGPSANALHHQYKLHWISLKDTLPGRRSLILASGRVIRTNGEPCIILLPVLLLIFLQG
ncbi:hypothetical protein EVAR_19511_1 [Eumeta japonica]|uniref:Uncharacterized protein n=1 Tax=Eumeta variegata TaxID=151549 RepID=A0A4C1V9N9_EUMVA|nr:hypothetical protein EVAR_19511_1 [Eumeta japonica]